MRIALVAAGVIALVIVVIVIVGYMLPASHVVARTTRIAQPVDSVHALIRDFAAYPQWRTGVTKVEMLGALRYRETSKQGIVTYDVVEDTPPHRLVTRIADRDLGYSGSWTYALSPEGAATSLTITEQGDVTNPIFRFLSRFVFGHSGTIEQYLRDVEARFR